MKRLTGFILLLLLVAKADAQVDLQSGSSVFSLPIFQWQDNKSRLVSAITLGYNSGNGLKVNSVASNVGQGWNLVAGGVITRIQVGQPDDQKAYYNGSTEKDNDLTKYPNGFRYADSAAYKGCPKALTKYPIYKARNILYRQHNTIAEDREMDYFSFEFNGKSGRFVIDPKTNKGWPIGDTKMKISFQEDFSMATGTNAGIRTTITSFTIQDVDGLIYTFSKLGMSKVLEQNFCDKTATRKLHQPSFKNAHVYYKTGFENASYINPWIINSWYLSTVEDPLTGRTIQFTYQTRSLNNLAGTNLIYNKGDKHYVLIIKKRSITQTPEISGITFPDGHQVHFNYQTASRADYPGEKALSTVDIKYKGRFLSEYQLNTTYFILNRYGTPVTDYEKSVARLCLKSVKKIGVDRKGDSPPYVFDYFLGGSAADGIVPPPFFYAKDIWGYYNGDASEGYTGSVVPLNITIDNLSFNQLRGLCFVRSSGTTPVLNPKAGYGKNGLLKQVIYPTGGTLSYEYSQNRGKLTAGGSERNVGGVHVSATRSTDGGYQNGCANPLITHYNYVTAASGNTSSRWGLEMPDNSMTVRTHYQPEQRKFRLLTLSCHWNYRYPGIRSQYQAINLSLFKSIITSSVLGVVSTALDILDVIKLIGSGTGPVFVIIDLITILVNVAISCIGDDAHDYTTTVYYNTDLNSGNPLPAQFKRVEIIQGSGGAGKTVQTFTSDEDYALWVPAGENQIHASQQRFAPWAYGLPKKSTLFNASGDTIRQTENIYDTSFAKHCINGVGVIPNSRTAHPAISVSVCNDSAMLSCHCEVLKTSSQRNTTWSNPSDTYYNGSNPPPTGLLNYSIYRPFTGRMELRTTYKRTFKPGNTTQFTEDQTDYVYNGYNNFELYKATTYQSNGDKVSKIFTYNSTYSTGLLYGLFNQHNIIALPVSTITTVQRAGESFRKYTNEQVTEYIQLTNGNVRPLRQLEQRLSQPQETLNAYSPSASLSNYHVISKYTYNGSGNLIGIQDEGLHKQTNIYGYGDKYIIATLANTDPLVDKYAYSSFEDTGLGGWTRNGTASYNTDAITGKRSLVLSSGKSLTAALNSNDSYTLSFWATHSLSVSGSANLVKSGPTYNGFTYYQYAIGAGPSSVSVTGSGKIDELRLYPQKATMRSISYDPLIGKTAECDENNRIRYYSYDNLGRLRLVEDEEKNTLKMYEYNNVSAAKRTGCPGTYSNRKVTEVFTRSNCPSGTAPDTNLFIYTIPAGKYTSIISQADADAQAQTELLTNGQTQANANSNCIALYYNNKVTVTDSTESCQVGYKGGWVTYTVPAHTYSSVVSQADADRKAQEEAEANVQWYANDPHHKTCTIDYAPDWEWKEGDPTDCRAVSPSVTHEFLLMTDENPNSSTYNQTQWKDSGKPGECPQPSFTLYIDNGGSTSYDIILTNQATNQNSIYTDVDAYITVYNFTSGTYSISIMPHENTGIYTTYEAGCGNTITVAEGDYVNFTDIPLNSQCNSIYIYH